VRTRAPDPHDPRETNHGARVRTGWLRQARNKLEINRRTP
jgi:hypothetical protein